MTYFWYKYMEYICLKHEPNKVHIIANLKLVMNVWMNGMTQSKIKSFILVLATFAKETLTAGMLYEISWIYIGLNERNVGKDCNFLLPLSNRCHSKINTPVWLLWNLKPYFVTETKEAKNCCEKRRKSKAELLKVRKN